MKNVMTTLMLALALLLAIGVSFDNGDSYCVIFPPYGRDLFGVAQRNILIIDDGEVSLIPQVHFEGNASDFGILVPVPEKPVLATAGTAVFSEASFLTQPLLRDTGASGCGCEDNVVVSPRLAYDYTGERGAVVDDTQGGVTIVYEQIVGAYQAVVLQATGAGDLTRWLDDNGYHYNPADSLVLTDYVAQNWFFVAMKLDTAQVPPRIDPWWSASTAPARISFPYHNSELTYPLKISAISTRDRVEVLVYTIAPDPMRFPGAKVEYANAIDAAETDAIAERYPTFYQLIKPGVFVTKLRRTFSKAEMSQDITIAPTSDRREFREIRYGYASGYRYAGAVLLVALAFYVTRRRKNTSDKTGKTCQQFLV